MRRRLSVWPILLALGSVCLAGCGSDQRRAQGNPLAPSPSPGPSPVQTSDVMPEPSAVIHVGDTVRGTLAKSLPECSFSTVDGGWGGLCQTFEITLPASGVLTATVRWTADAPLELFFKTSSGERIDMQCCGVPLSFRASVEQGVTYRIEIAYGGRPAGYPNIPPVDYTLDTSLTAGEVTALGSVRAILLGDETRTQRISGARIELTDGPQAGRTAGFDPSTGIYEISGVPMGFVGIRASADGFVPLSSRIAVGTNVATEFVLERLVPLSDASYSLGGLIYAYPSTPGDSSFSAWGRRQGRSRGWSSCRGLHG